MGLTYRSQTGRGRRSEFDVNSAGAFLLCKIHQSLELPTHKSPNDEEPYRVPYNATSSQCDVWAEVIINANPTTIIQSRIQDYFDGSDLDYYRWSQRWAYFLKKCARRGGYIAE